MVRQRGRPPVLNDELIKNAISNHAQEIVTSEGKIISKHNEIWTTISKEIGQMKPHNLYTIVVNNRFNIRDTLLEKTIGLR